MKVVLKKCFDLKFWPDIFLTFDRVDLGKHNFSSVTNKLVRGLEILKRLQKQIEHCRVETLCVT